MAESLREVIARMKAQQSSQTSNKPAPIPVPVPTQAMGQAEDDEEDEDEEIPAPQEKVAVMPSKPIAEASQSEDKPKEQELSREQQILMEIEMLQNNGRFRAELLHQLQEINKALVVIAGTLVDLSGYDKKTN